MTTITERYRKLRSENRTTPATYLIAWARQEKPVDFDGDDILATVDGRSTVELTRGKFTIHITACLDEFPDTSHLGEYSDTWQDGAIRNPESLTDSVMYDWYVPMNTEASHYKALRDMKYGKSLAHELARSYVYRDMQSLRDYQSFVLFVRAFANGIELGCDSLGGIDIDISDPSYLADCVLENGMIDNVIEQATDAIAGLCHDWQISKFTETKTCSKCGLLPLDQDDTDSPCPANGGE